MKPYTPTELKRLLAKGELQEIFPLLEEVIEQNNEQLLQFKLAKLDTEFKTILKHERMGLVDYSELTHKKNRITYKLLSIINMIPI